MEWQPIETAPENADFLLYDGRGQYHVVEGGHTIDRPDGSREWFDGDVFVSGTHWMPLPPPPSEKGSGQ